MNKFIPFNKVINLQTLSKFPDNGVCWNPNVSLLNHLKNRSNNQSGMSINGNDLAQRGLAWNAIGMWTVSNKSSQPEYSIEELMRHIPPKIPDNLVGHPLIPSECYTPEKWAIIVDLENIELLSKFLKEHHLEWIEYRDNWRLHVASYFHYPSIGGHSSYKLNEGYTLVTTNQIMHVLTNNNNNLKTKQNEQEETSSSEQHVRGCTSESISTLKICRPNLSIRRGEEIRATTIRCPKSQIRIRSINS